MAQDPLRDHVEYFKELGVEGVHPDALWRSRADPSVKKTDERRGRSPDRPESHEVSDLIPVSAVGTAGPDSLPLIKADIGPDCSRCKLHTLGRKQVVFGVGNPDADLMFVGEAPGADEDIQGEPFVGRAGQLLTKIIEAMGYTRKDVYIANVLKCRPPGNRNPEPDEVATCQPFLLRQIDVVQPKVMVALGTFAAQALLNSKDPISRLRGRAWPCRNRLLVPTFHPAFLLRSPDRKRDTWDDMKLVMSILRGERES